MLWQNFQRAQKSNGMADILKDFVWGFNLFSKFLIFDVRLVGDNLSFGQFLKLKLNTIYPIDWGLTYWMVFQFNCIWIHNGHLSECYKHNHNLVLVFCITYKMYRRIKSSLTERHYNAILVSLTWRMP